MKNAGCHPQCEHMIGHDPRCLHSDAASPRTLRSVHQPASSVGYTIISAPRDNPYEADLSECPLALRYPRVETLVLVG